MSTSKSKHRECNSPVRVLDKQTDDQPDGSVDPIPADNTVQLEFLQFLKTLDDAPHDLGSVSQDDSAHLGEQMTSSDLESQLPHMPHDNDDLTAQKPETPSPTKQPLESLLSHNFTHKLHLAATSEQVTFINWTADGKHLQLDYMGLQEHLCGGQCMFRSRSILQFTRQLIEVGFERALQELEHDDRPQLYYQHAHFKPYHVEQLLLIPTPQFERLGTPKTPQTRNACPLGLGTAKDLCASHQSAYSPLQLARFRFQTLLHYHNDVRLLQEREPNAEQLLPRRGRISSSRLSAQSSLAPALASKHMNPRDSVLQFEAGKVPDYAGFYGRVEPSLISEFFAEYLPRYGASTSGYKDIVVDASKANSFQQNLPIGVVSSEDEDELADHDRHETNTLSAAGEHDRAQTTENCHPPPEDIELEQVMQELCGIGGEQGEVDPEKKEVTPLKPKLKRKKLVRKCAITDTDLEHESPTDDHGEDLLHAAAAAEAYIKDTQKTGAKDNEDDVDCSSSNNETDKDLKCQPDSKNASKRRRYDLRNSKSKRPR
ncbi:uncharacterized protein LOC111601224 [Drosophila hydei]|uniref:Uncharacterized protein LOC111601224 n=1 Tax=Drosophila hydei TaxID=7224 RepID=A0A6J1M381_DROHY|nr:uncharacterized protein LOC111601224 [Drosophila hydei]